MEHALSSLSLEEKVTFEGYSPLQRHKNNYCFILANSTFNGIAEDLPGYEDDVGTIQGTFKRIGFTVEVARNKKAVDIINIFNKWSRYDFKDSTCVIVFILSHGFSNGIIYGVDYNQIKIDKIESIFSYCKELENKPKLFFLQACRGIYEPEIEGEVVRAGGLMERKHSPDTFLHCSTTEGFVSYVKRNGAPFIKKVCNVFKEHSQRCNLTDLATMVNKKVSEDVLIHYGIKVAQCPEVVHTLRGDFYFTESYDLPKNEGSDLVKYYVRKKNPCFLITSTTCKTHVSQCGSINLMKGVIEQKFSYLNFEIDETMDNMNVGDIQSNVKQLRTTNFSCNDCVAFFVLACGNVRCNNRKVILGRDGKLFCINTLVSAVNENGTLRGTPKLFFVMIIRCEKAQFNGSNDVTQAGNCSWPKYANTFTYFIFVDNGEECTFFLKTICNVMSSFAEKGYNFNDMILEMNKIVYQKHIIPDVACSLTYNLFFKHLKNRRSNCAVSDAKYCVTPNVKAVKKPKKNLRRPLSSQMCENSSNVATPIKNNMSQTTPRVRIIISPIKTWSETRRRRRTSLLDQHRGTPTSRSTSIFDQHRGTPTTQNLMRRV